MLFFEIQNSVSFCSSVLYVVIDSIGTFSYSSVVIASMYSIDSIFHRNFVISY